MPRQEAGDTGAERNTERENSLEIKAMCPSIKGTAGHTLVRPTQCWGDRDPKTLSMNSTWNIHWWGELGDWELCTNVLGSLSHPTLAVPAVHAINTNRVIWRGTFVNIFWVTSHEMQSMYDFLDFYNSYTIFYLAWHQTILLLQMKYRYCISNQQTWCK